MCSSGTSATARFPVLAVLPALPRKTSPIPMPATTFVQDRAEVRAGGATAEEAEGVIDPLCLDSFGADLLG